MRQALGKAFLDTLSFSPYGDPLEELLMSPLAIRTDGEPPELAQGCMGRKEQDWGLTPDF